MKPVFKTGAIGRSAIPPGIQIMRVFRRFFQWDTVVWTPTVAALIHQGPWKSARVAPFGAYVLAVQAGNILFLSGMLAGSGHAATVIGIVGKDLDLNAGRQAAYTAPLNVLALTKQQPGPLSRVSRVVRLGVYVAAPPEFMEHPKVADAVSEPLCDVFGDQTVPSRLGIGVASPPLASPVEPAVILEVKV